MVMLEHPQHLYQSGPDSTDRPMPVTTEDPAFAAAVDALLERSGGWRLTRIRRRHRHADVGDGDDAVALQALLDELSDELGVVVPPRQQARLMHMRHHDVAQLTDALFRAAGMDPRLFPTLRKQITERVARHLS